MKTIFARLLTAGTALTLPALAFAQAAPTGSATKTEGPAEQSVQSDDLSIPDVVVTAQKRATNIQDTPIAIRAFVADDLLKAGVNDVNGLARLAPDLGVTTDTVFTKIAIRGVSSVDISEAGDPALTVSIDGEYINRPVGLNASFFDLERIEVLRGPQGTLFGRNSTAGALNIVAAKPRIGEFGGYATAGYGNFDAITGEAAVNVPLGDTAAIRVAGLHTQHDGYTNNGAVGRGDTGNVDAARAAIAFEPGNLKVYLAGEYVNIDQTAPSQYGAPFNATTAGNVLLPRPSAAYTDPLSYTVPAGFDLPSTFDPDTFPLANLGRLNSEQWAVRGSIAYDFGAATITYIGGYRDNRTSGVQPLNGFLPETFTFYNNKLNSKTQSHELRLNGGTEGQFVWQAGGFYFHETQEVARGLLLPQVAGGSFLNYFYRNLKSTSKAAFAQATYWIAPDVFGITAGVRYTDDDKSGTYTNFGAQFGRGTTPPPITDTTRAGYVVLRPSAASDQVTWTVGADYKAAPDSLLYAKVSKGYKSGGFDNVGNFQPETIVAYEVGSKNEFANRTIQLNLAGFYYDYKDQQIQVYVNPTVGSRTQNAGKSRIWGIEADFKVRLSRNDTFTATANYLNAKLTDFAGVALPTLANPPAGQPAVTVNLAGNKPPQAPRWTIAVGYDHIFRMGDSKIVASAYSRFKSEYFIGAFNFRGERQPAFTATDLALEYLSPGETISVRGYVRNLEDNRIRTYASFTGGGINLYNAIFGAPRTYGIQGTFKF